MILITGGTGFIGTAVKEKLIKKRASFKIVSRTPNDNENQISWGAARGLIQSNQIQAVLHLATCYDRNDQSVEVVKSANYTLPKSLADVIHGKDTLFVNVDTFYNKFNDYQYLKNYTKYKNKFRQYLDDHIKQLSFKNIFLEHVYGPGDNPDKFIPTIQKQMATGADILLTDCSQKRDFVYVDDVANCLIDVCTNSFSYPAKKYEVGTGSSVKIRDFLEYLAEKLNFPVKKLKFSALEQRENEILNSFSRNTIDFQTNGLIFHSYIDGIDQMLKSAD